MIMLNQRYPKFVAIRHMWQQKLSIWPQGVVQKILHSISLEFLTKMATSKPLFVATIVVNVATEIMWLDTTVLHVCSTLKI